MFLWLKAIILKQDILEGDTSLTLCEYYTYKFLMISLANSAKYLSYT